MARRVSPGDGRNETFRAVGHRTSAATRIGANPTTAAEGTLWASSTRKW